MLYTESVCGGVEGGLYAVPGGGLYAIVGGGGAGVPARRCHHASSSRGAAASPSAVRPARERPCPAGAKGARCTAEGALRTSGRLGLTSCMAPNELHESADRAVCRQRCVLTELGTDNFVHRISVWQRNPISVQSRRIYWQTGRAFRLS